MGDDVSEFTGETLLYAGVRVELLAGKYYELERINPRIHETAARNA